MYHLGHEIGLLELLQASPARPQHHMLIDYNCVPYAQARHSCPVPSLGSPPLWFGAFLAPIGVCSSRLRHLLRRPTSTRMFDTLEPGLLVTVKH